MSNRRAARLNPFGAGNEDDDITIDFRPQTAECVQNDVLGVRRTPPFSPISENTVHNKHRPFHAHVQFEPPVPPPTPPRRVFGGSIPLSRDNSADAVQLRAESRVQFFHSWRPSPTRNPITLSIYDAIPKYISACQSSISRPITKYFRFWLCIFFQFFG